MIKCHLNIRPYKGKTRERSLEVVVLSIYSLSKRILRNRKSQDTSQNACNFLPKYLDFLLQTGERPFVCTFEGCFKEFITKGHLKTHELIHSGDRPFACDICGKSYSRSGRLKIHQRTHVSYKNIQRQYILLLKKINQQMLINNLFVHMSLLTIYNP